MAGQYSHYITVADPDLQLRRGPAFEGLTMNVEFCEDNFAICAISEIVKAIKDRRTSLSLVDCSKYTLFDGLTYNTRGYFCKLRSIFPSLEGERKNTNNEQNAR